MAQVMDQGLRRTREKQVARQGASRQAMGWSLKMFKDKSGRSEDWSCWKHNRSWSGGSKQVQVQLIRRFQVWPESGRQMWK